MRVKMSKQPPPAPTASAGGPCPHRWACSIGRLPCVAGVLSPFSIIFSEIIGPSESKFLGILHRAEAKEVNMTYMI